MLFKNLLQTIDPRILCNASVAVPVIHTIFAMQTIWIDFDPLVDSQAAFDF